MVHKCASTEHTQWSQHSATCGAWRPCLSKGTVTEGLVLGLANSCPTLRVLKVTHCFADNSTEAWQAFAAGHPSLREFSLSSVTDDMMVALSTHCPRSNSIDLQSAQLLTDQCDSAIQGVPRTKPVDASAGYSTLRRIAASFEGTPQAVPASAATGRDASAHEYLVV
jgi:hypothetical protein